MSGQSSLCHSESLQCLTNKLRFVVGHHLVEDVVASLIRQLETYSGLLQQVCEKHG